MRRCPMAAVTAREIELLPHDRRKPCLREKRSLRAKNVYEALLTANFLHK